MTGVTISAVLQCILTWRAVASVANQQAVPIRFGFHDADVHILTKFALPAALNGFVSVPAILVWKCRARPSGRRAPRDGPVHGREQLSDDCALSFRASSTT